MLQTAASVTQNGNGELVAEIKEAWAGRAAALGCAVLLACLVFLAHPFAEMGIVDDWSYAYSAKVLASTGHIVYNGWGAMPQTWVLYWGALFIRMFGFSFFVLRCSILLVSMVTVFMVHRLLRRTGFSETLSTVGTVAVMLASPFFSLCFLYMSDIPGMLALVVCFYGVVRAVHAKTVNAATGWLVFAAVSNLLLGSVRQIALLGVLAVVPCAALRLRPRVRLAALLPVWLVCVACVGALLHWFAAQPYSVLEPLLPATHLWRRMGLLIRTPMSQMFYLAPVMVLFAAALRWRDRRVRMLGGALAVCMAVLYVVLIGRHTYGLLFMPYLADTVLNAGFHASGHPTGNSPVLLSRPWYAGLSCVSWALAAGVAAYACFPDLRASHAPVSREPLQVRQLLQIVAPFTVIYLLLFATRVLPFDRYLLPLTPLFVMAALYPMERYSGRRALPVCAGILAMVLAAFDIALLHDEFALYNARVEAANKLIASGVPRTDIFGGFEYDGWTEVEASGYVKDPKLKLKPGEQGFDKTLTWAPFTTRFFYRGYTPTIQPLYVISHTVYPGTERAVPDTFYKTWMRPGIWPIFALRVTARGSQLGAAQ